MSAPHSSRTFRATQRGEAKGLLFVGASGVLGQQSSIQDRLSHGFRARGWPSGKSENSLNVTGSYISKRKIPGQKSLGAKCLCCDVFAPRKARGLLSCCCLRSHIAFTCLQLRLNAIVVLHFLLLLSWLHLFLLYFFFLL